MASLVNNYFKQLNAKADIDLDADTFHAALLSTNCTADTDPDAQFVSDLTLDEFDATGYARVTISNPAVNLDLANDRAEFDFDDLSFTGMSGDGTRDVQGVLILKFVTNDAASTPIVFIDFTTDAPLESSQIDITINAEGALNLT